MKYRTGLIALTVAAGTALLTGCAGEEPPTPVEYGSARPAGDTLGLKPPRGSAVTLSQWPDGCKLVTDEELRAVLPQAKSVTREPRKLTIMNFNPLVEAAPGTTGDVPRAGCKYEFHLPSDGEKEFPNSHFSLLVTTIADPALVAKEYREDKDRAVKKEKGFADLAGSWGAKDCYRVGEGFSAKVTCLQGAYVFEVDGDTDAAGVAQMPEPGAEKSENLAAVQKRRDLWMEKVLPQIARTVAARLS
ncbi:hypothetical protein [Streptomyces sp. NPDC058657]|uniref:hypothetical protein n=1 Tax=unclassified Streptomyces TaxID=2593676 RepID=UPI00364A89BD